MNILSLLSILRPTDNNSIKYIGIFLYKLTLNYVFVIQTVKNLVRNVSYLIFHIIIMLVLKTFFKYYLIYFYKRTNHSLPKTYLIDPINLSVKLLQYIDLNHSCSV